MSVLFRFADLQRRVVAPGAARLVSTILFPIAAATLPVATVPAVAWGQRAAVIALATASATLIPSTAAERMPPA